MNTETQKIKLYNYRAENITLEKAIASVKEHLKGAVALFYSPRQCQLLTFKEDQKLYDHHNRVIDIPDKIGDVFEARIFNPQGELRWLNRNKGVGEAVFLSESHVTLEGFKTLETKKAECLEQQYLLWGQKAKNQPQAEGWQRLAEARIGKLEIPLPQSLKEHQRVYLKTFEYLASVDDFGNYAVIEERLIELEVK